MTSFLTRVYGNRTAAIRAKWIVLVLFGLGALAYWSGSEAVLPAYVAGMLLAEFAAKEHHWVRRMRTLTIGFLTPFYFLRAGTLVSLPALIAAPLIFLVLFFAKVIPKVFGLYPVKGSPRPVKFVSYIWKRIDGFIIDSLRKELLLCTFSDSIEHEINSLTI